MRLRQAFTPDAWEEYLDWQKTDRKRLKRLNRVIEDTRRSPYEGIGKPEALRGDLEGYWSRRIDSEHRLVYRVEDSSLLIVQCRRHY